MMGLRLDSHVLIGALMLRADQLRLLVPSLLDHLNVLRISLLAPSLGQSLSFRMHISKFMEQMFAAHPILVVELKHLGQKPLLEVRKLIGKGDPFGLEH
jgi:hypothetical protein